MNPFFLTQGRKGAKLNLLGAFATWRETLA
jgi:hypothetical protein